MIITSCASSKDEKRQCATVLASAFLDDPASQYLFPDEESRERKLEKMYSIVIDQMIVQGKVEIASDANCRGSVAVWQAPLPPALTYMQAFATIAKSLVWFGGACSRMQRLYDATWDAHPSMPHWYLAAIGTHFGSQSRGLARSLMQRRIEYCDAHKLPIYLEASKSDLLGYYKQYGFSVTAEISISETLTLWGMLREPSLK